MNAGRSAGDDTVLSQRVHAAVLHALLFRRTPTRDRVAETISVPVAAVGDALTLLATRGACVDDGRGTVVAAYPLSAVPTPYAVDLGWAAPWACCAIDALAVPSMVGGRGTITSSCTTCGRPIAVTVEDSRVLSADPASVVVVFGGLTGNEGRPALEACCPYITLFCSTAHAEQWRPPATWRGEILPLDRAVQRAVASFRRVIDVYQQYRPQM